MRTVLRLHPRMAPVKCGVFPLLKNRPELVAKAREIASALRPLMAIFYDEAGAIGRRYRRQDEAGTPFGVTVDFDTDRRKRTRQGRHSDFAPSRQHEAGAHGNFRAERPSAGSDRLKLATKWLKTSLSRDASPKIHEKKS